MSIAPLNLGRVLSAQARLQPEKVAVRDLARAMSYRQWNARACRLANALAGIGLAQRDRVAVLAYNRVEWAEIYAAAAKAGLVAVPVNFRLTGEEVHYILEDCGARALGAHGERVEDPSELSVAIAWALARAPAVIDVVTSRDAVSSDARKGLGFVPDYQALTAWDEAERRRRREA